VSEVDWQQDVLDFLGEHQRHFLVVNLLGGEPLLLKENLDFLRMIDPNTRISLVTNLSVEGVADLPVYQELLNRSCSWLVSLEATGNRFEWIRRNAKWDTTKQNYANLNTKDAKYPSSKGVHMTYCTYSAFTLVDTFDWLREVEPDPNYNFSHISVCLGPDMFNIYNFTPEIKKAAVDEIDRCLSKHDDYLTDGQKNILSNIRESLLNKLEYVNLPAIRSFKDHVMKIDSAMAHIKFSNEWPILNHLLMRV
jgi:hypothetical protein